MRAFLLIALLLIKISPVWAQTPDHRHIVQRVYDSGAFEIASRPGLCAFVRAAVTELHRHDPGWGFLKKRQPQNGCYDQGALEGYSVDTAYYYTSRQTVDFMRDCGDAGCQGLAWGISGTHMSLGDWVRPDVGPAPPPPPIPTDVAAVLEQVGALREQVRALTAEVGALRGLAEETRDEVRAVRSETEQMRAGVDVLASRPLPPTEFRGGVFGFPVVLRAPQPP